MCAMGVDTLAERDTELLVAIHDGMARRGEVTVMKLRTR